MYNFLSQCLWLCPRPSLWHSLWQRTRALNGALPFALTRALISPFVCALVIIASYFPAHAFADLGPILITGGANNSDAPAFRIGDVPAGEYTGTRETINASQLQSAGTSLAEVAAAKSGVQFRQSGGLGSHSVVSLRGSSAEQVNVYLDGVLLNEAAGGGVNLSDIELLDAQQVDIYRGSVPVQLGDTAIGGAVNITTLRAGDQPLPRVLLGSGSFGSHRVSAAWRGPLTLTHTDQLVATFSHRQSDNNFGFLFDNRTPLNPSDDSRQQRSNNQTSTTSALLKGSHPLGGNRVESVLQWFDRRQGISNPLNNTSSNAQLDTSNFQFRSIWRSTPSVEGNASLWELTAAIKDEHFNDSNGQIGLATQNLRSQTNIAGIKHYREQVTSKQSLAFTFKLRNEELKSRDLLRQLPETQAQRVRLDAAGQLTRFYNDGASVFNAGLFASSINDDFSVGVNGTLDRNYQQGFIAPQLGFSHKTKNDINLRFNISSQQRAPSFFELFGSQGLFEGNAELRSEKAINAEFGISWQGYFQRIESLQSSAVFFTGNRRRLITNVYDSRGIGHAENIARARITGLELNTAMQFANGWKSSANLTFQNAINQSNISGQRGMQLPGEAAVSGNLSLTKQLGKWQLEYSHQWRLDTFYDSGNRLPAADQRTHDVTLSWQRHDWRWELAAHNLTNQNYEDFNGFPKPGRSFFITFIYQPERTN